MAYLESIIKKPLITEKALISTERQNKYGFQVDLKSNKNQIRMAVEKLYDVRVLGVQTIIMPGKMKKAGKFVKKSSKIKKAYVQLEEGQKIESFKGV